MSELAQVLVIGAGSIGERHVRTFQQTDRACVSLCEVNPQIREQVGDRYGLEQVFDEFAAALDSQPQVAVICTPAHLHVPMALELARRGVHLLIEKPVSTSLDGLDELTAELTRNDVVAAVAYVYRAHPALARMRQSILDGEFGSPVQVVVNAGQHFPFYRPAYRQIYYADRACGGGAIQDALTHFVNAVEWLVGPITRVAADAAHQVLDGVDVEDTVHVIARHQADGGNPLLASYSHNQHQAVNEGSITVNCQRGTTRIELHRKRWRYVTQPEQPWIDDSFPRLARDDVFVRQAHAFLDAVDQKEPPLCSLAEGVQTLKVNLAILEAWQSQTWQSIPTG